MILIYFLSLFSMMVGEEWTREIGVGDGGVVHCDGVLYVASSDLPNQISRKTSRNTGVEKKGK